jgi:hypothetical protein
MRFFDRKSIIELLNRRVFDLKEGYRQNIALLGPEFIGKTSILEEFLAQLGDDNIIPVYLALGEINFDIFVKKFIGRLVFNFLRNKKVSPADNFEVLLQESQRFIPVTAQHIKKIRLSLDKDKRIDAYRDLLSLPEIFEQETGCFCLVILDEFHRLEEFELPNIFQELGKKIMVQKKSIYIVTSSQRRKAERILSEKLSLLFGNFEVLDVGQFSIKTSLEYVEEELREHSLEKSYKNFLVDLTGGHPFYLNVICHQLIVAACEEGQRNIFLNNFINGLEEVLFASWGVLNQHFYKILNNVCVKKGKASYPAELLSVAGGHNKITDIMEDLGCNNKAVSLRLNQLVESGILTKNGNLYFFSDKLLAFWLRFVYQKKLNGLEVSSIKLSVDFKNELKQRISSFIQVSGNEFEERITDLLQSFDNELFQLNGRKHRLPAFSAIRPLSFNGQAVVNLRAVIAESERDLWAVTFKEGLIIDADVTAFLAATKELSNRVTRRVIISLYEIESNAKLRALQEKMWIWNARDLNFILNLFGKPYIVK